MTNAVLAATGILASGGSGSAFSTVTQGVSNFMGIVTTMLTSITGNEILSTLFVYGFIPSAIAILTMLKRASVSYTHLRAHET